MNAPAASGEGSWADAALAAALCAIDGAGLGGVLLRARVGPARERWLATLRGLTADRPMPKLPLHAGHDRLAGGLDLAATLRSGRPVAERGLLHEADGGVLLVAMSERLDAGLAAAVAAAMDAGRVRGAATMADGPADETRFAVVALDEGVEPDERTPDVLADRLALHVDLDCVTSRDIFEPDVDAAGVAAARDRLAGIRADEAAVQTLCVAALALGIESMRAPWLALRAARAAAALDGRDAVGDDDLAVAARLVLGPRATRLPAAPESEADQAEPDEPPADDDTEATTDDAAQPEPAPDESVEDDEKSAPDPGELAELVLAAARASIPPGLLDATRTGAVARRRGTGGKAGALQNAGLRGRPAGLRKGRPGPDARLNLVETLRAAAPWQTLRRGARPDARARVQVRADDFRVTRFRQRRETTTIFVVDASGSAALHRLAEAKGAVELLLADCYVRRDRVALVTFRGKRADVLLPPTRSLVQAKRRLAELPGGGGTPLAAGLASALELAGSALRHGQTPVIVVLTDGRANIAADGTPGREQAHLDALAAGRSLRAAGMTVLLIDTSPRPRPPAEELAAEMGARYLPLPYADAAHLSAAVRAGAA